MKRFYYPLHLRNARGYNVFVGRLSTLQELMEKERGKSIPRAQILRGILSEGFSRHECNSGKDLILK